MDIHKNARLSFRSRESLARFVIEQGAAHFERRRHRHAVHFYQHVTGEVGGGFEVHGMRKYAGVFRQKTAGERTHQEAGVGGQHPFRLQQALA